MHQSHLDYIDRPDLRDTQDSREPVARRDNATAGIIERAQGLSASDGIDSAIRYMENCHIDRATILRVLCSPRYHRRLRTSN